MKTNILVIIFSLSIYQCVSGQNIEDISERTAILDTAYHDLPILHLNGSPYENGFQHGSIMKSRIIELIGLWKKDIEGVYHIPADEFINVFLDSTDYVSTIVKLNPDLLEEIRGIGKGAGIDFKTIFAFQLLDEIWANAKLLDLPHHCTSVGVNNYKKDGGPNYIAQTVDITPFYHGYGILLDIKDKNTASRKLIFSFVGFVGINGLNKNIGIIGNTVLNLKSSLNGVPVCCVVRCVLGKESFSEAVDFIRRIKHASGANYIIGSKADLISLECAEDLVTEYWPDTTRLYTYHANNPLTNTSYNPAYLTSSRNTHISVHDLRFETMESSIIKNKTVDLALIEGVLSKKPICNDNTWVSVIMEFGYNHGILRITPGKPDSTEYIKFVIGE